MASGLNEGRSKFRGAVLNNLLGQKMGRGQEASPKMGVLLKRKRISPAPSLGILFGNLTLPPESIGRLQVAPLQCKGAHWAMLCFALLCFAALHCALLHWRAQLAHCTAAPLSCAARLAVCSSVGKLRVCGELASCRASSKAQQQAGNMIQRLDSSQLRPNAAFHADRRRPVGPVMGGRLSPLLGVLLAPLSLACFVVTASRVAVLLF